MEFLWIRRLTRLNFNMHLQTRALFKNNKQTNKSKCLCELDIKPTCMLFAQKHSTSLILPQNSDFSMLKNQKEKSKRKMLKNLPQYLDLNPMQGKIQNCLLPPCGNSNIYPLCACSPGNIMRFIITMVIQ